MSHNTLETGGLIIATVAVLLVIMMAYEIEESSVDGLSQVTHEWSTGEGMKVAGSFHILNKEEDFGSFSVNTVNDMMINQDGYCRVNMPGFGTSQPLRYEALDQCHRTHRPVRTLFRIDFDDGDSTVQTLEVGGRQP